MSDFISLIKSVLTLVFFPERLEEILDRESNVITPPVVAAPSTPVSDEILEGAAPSIGPFTLLNSRIGLAIVGIVGIVGTGAFVYYTIVQSPEQVINLADAGIAANNDPVIAGFGQSFVTANESMLTINEGTTRITPLESTGRALAGRLQVDDEIVPEEEDNTINERTTRNPLEGTGRTFEERVREFEEENVRHLRVLDDAIRRGELNFFLDL